MIYVFDATAFIAIGREAQDVARIFGPISDLVEAGAIVFCDEVVEELERLADPGIVLLVRHMKRLRANDGADYAYVRVVLAQVPLLLDGDVPGEDACVPALAQAIAMRDDGDEVSVVTDDVVDKPTRIALASACHALDVDCMLPRNCLAQLEIEELLA